VFVFGSEIKAVLAHPAVPRDYDWRTALGAGLTLPVRAKPPQSFFTSVQYVPAATIVDVDLESGELSQQVYWTPNRNVSPADVGAASSASYVARYRDLLADAVHLQLMSDVELVCS